ncbi:MAG TPA: CGNR zinc finger domain-containing protein [Nocardioidaceae bacterium]|nr:CGNR zinc finger domain-containing protein [Nocardioidaceae bacterium]
MSAIATTSPGKGTATPAQADLLCAFANTLDVDVDAAVPDALTDATELTNWLRQHDLLDVDDRADSGDLELALTLRSGLREAMLRHADGDTMSRAPDLDATATALPLRIVFDGTRPRLTPAVSGARGALAQLLVAVADTQADDTWGRLKICVANECQWAFYDTSKNRSRHWCSMGVCGNRQKTRRYRARQRAKR